MGPNKCLGACKPTLAQKRNCSIDNFTTRYNILILFSTLILNTFSSFTLAIPLNHGRASTPAPSDQLPEETDTLEEAEEEKKRRKGKTEERCWSAVETDDVSGSDSSWRCRLCQRCFSSSWQLMGHCCTGIAGEDGVAHGHKVKLEFRCPVCGDRFLRPTAFIMHKRSHMGQSQYVCGVCGRTLKSLRKLASHKRSHSRRRGTVAERQQCHDCSQSFCNLTALRSHRERQHGEERIWEDEEDRAVREEEEGSTAVISNDSTRVSGKADSLLVFPLV